MQGHIEMVSPAGLQWVRDAQVAFRLDQGWTMPVKKKSKKPTVTGSSKSETKTED